MDRDWSLGGGIQFGIAVAIIIFLCGLAIAWLVS